MTNFNAQSTPLTGTIAQSIQKAYSSSQTARKKTKAMLDSLYSAGYRAKDFDKLGPKPVSLIVGEAQQEQPRYTQLHKIYTQLQTTDVQALLALTAAERRDSLYARETVKRAKKIITDSIANLQKGLTNRVKEEEDKAKKLEVISSIPKADMDTAVLSGTAAVNRLVDAAIRDDKEKENPLVKRVEAQLVRIVAALKKDGRYPKGCTLADAACDYFTKEHQALEAEK